MNPSLRVIFFDVGGTLLRVRPSVGSIYAGAVERLGYRVDPGEVQVRFRRALARSTERRRRDDYRCDDDTLRREWLRIVTECLEGDLPGEAIEEIFGDLYDRFSRAEAWQLAEGARPTLEALASGGLRLGILSNWDSRLEETLGSLELLDYFAPELRVVSHAVGHEKPHPKIFEHAVNASGVSPAEILFVGDSLECDIRPATRHGLHSLWIADSPETGVDQRLESLRVRSFTEIRARIESGFRMPGRSSGEREEGNSLINHPRRPGGEIP